MGHGSRRSWVNCVMSHMGHGSRKMTHFQLWVFNPRFGNVYLTLDRWHFARKELRHCVNWACNKIFSSRTYV